jgi:spore germination protein
VRSHAQANSVPGGHAAGHGGPGSHAATGPGQPRGRRRVRRRVRWLLWSGLVVLLAVGLVVGLLVTGTAQTTGTKGPARTSVAALPYWSFSNGTSTVLANRQDFSEVSPWIYGLSTQQQVTADIGRLRASGLHIMPTIANVTGGDFTYAPAARILHDPAVMSSTVKAITALATKNDYAGVDIDFEGLQAGDRQDFTTFLTDLATALHAKGKILSVALFAKASDAGYGPQNVAEDYAAIGRVVDQVRLMTYDYHWNTSAPGPIAPVSWVRDVLAYAKTQIPLSKIILGIPLYGYDWIGNNGSDLTSQQAEKLATQYKATIHYDSTSQSPWFTYTDSSGRTHTVWFEDSQSSAAKFAIAKQEGVGGVFMWMYGDEASGTWSQLHRYLPVIGQPIASPTGRS